MTPSREVAVVFCAVTILVVAMTAAAGAMPALDSFVPVAVATLFLYAAIVLARRDPRGPHHYGISLEGILEPPFVRETFLRVVLAEGLAVLRLVAVVFPPFIVGFYFWNQPTHPFRLSLPPDLWSFALAQWLVVGIPEEAFFRGYVQTRLSDVLTKRTNILGVAVSVPVLVIQAALFAAIHYAVDGAVVRLAVFFPGLLFGWIRQWRGGIGAGGLFHALCNILSDLLVYGWLETHR